MEKFAEGRSTALTGSLLQAPWLPFRASALLAAAQTRRRPLRSVGISTALEMDILKQELWGQGGTGWGWGLEFNPQIRVISEDSTGYQGLPTADLRGGKSLPTFRVPQNLSLLFLPGSDQP